MEAREIRIYLSKTTIAWMDFAAGFNGMSIGEYLTNLILDDRDCADEPDRQAFESTLKNL